MKERALRPANEWAVYDVDGDENYEVLHERTNVFRGGDSVAFWQRRPILQCVAAGDSTAAAVVPSATSSP